MCKPVLTRWSIPFAGFLLALMGGISYAWGVFVVPMTKTFNWTSAQATLPFTAFMVIFAIAMVPAGMLQDKIGPRKVSLLGAILFFVAYSLASLVELIPHPWWLVLTYSLIGGIACGLVYACVAPPCQKMVPRQTRPSHIFCRYGFWFGSCLSRPPQSQLSYSQLWHRRNTHHHRHHHIPSFSLCCLANQKPSIKLVTSKLVIKQKSCQEHKP